MLMAELRSFETLTKGGLRHTAVAAESFAHHQQPARWKNAQRRHMHNKLFLVAEPQA